MHFETSMSLATSTVWRIDGAGVVVAERCWRSNDCNDDMAAPLRLLDGHDERLELRRLRVRVADERCQRIGDVADPRHAGVTPVNRDTNGVHLGAAAVERHEATGDTGNRLDLAPVRPNLDHV